MKTSSLTSAASSAQAVSFRPRPNAQPAKPEGSKGVKRGPIYETCVLCGHAVEVGRGQLRGAEAFAICSQDDARLDAALARLTREVLALLDGPHG